MVFLPSFLDEIKARLPISQVVGRRVKLKRAGREWRGLSPFSNEKAPSFTVNDGKGFFHDLSTGKHGDIFSFLMETEGITYSEAVERLANLAGFSPNEIAAKRSIISSPSDVRNWLRSQTYQVSLIYGVRTALRAVPFLAALSASKRPEGSEIGSLILSCFRANSLAWIVARYPSRKKSFRQQIKASFQNLNDQTQGWEFESPAHLAVGRALASAARASEDSPAIASNAALNIEHGYTKVPSLFADLELDSVLDDIKLIDEGLDPTDLIQRPLWPNGMPLVSQTDWQELEDGLLSMNEDWFVWTEWYKARVSGRHPIEAIEIARARLASKVWQQAPKIVNAKIREIVSEKVQPAQSLVPIDNIPSPFSFQISEDGKIGLASSPSNLPQFPYANSKREQRDRLNVCRALAQDMISDLRGRKFQARPEYVEGFEKYASRLPNNVDEGNFLLAEAEARTLRSLFAAEASILSVAFAAKLKTFLEQHMGLRVFYPDVANFYRDVRSGRMIEPLPLDAIEGILDGVRQNTPMVFDSTVQVAIEGSLTSKVPVDLVNAQDVPPVDASQPLPPNDPLGEISAQTASDYTFAGATNGIWKAFLNGEKIYKALEGWSKARETLSPHVSEILGWLRRLISAGSGIPPIPPDISI